MLTSFRPDVPPRLASVVAKCLAKTPGERYANYPALAAALEPFRSAALTPASLGRRFLAGFIDNFTSAAAAAAVQHDHGRAPRRGLRAPGHVAAAWSCRRSSRSSLYYTILEGRFGCGFGKAVLNLRVVDEAQTAPGLRRAFIRAVVFLLPPQLVSQAVGLLLLRYAAATPAGVSAGNVVASVAGFASVLTTLLVLGVDVPDRAPRQRFRGASTIASTRTRVVVRPQAIEARQSRKALPGGSVSAPRPAGDARIGPYVVDARAERTASVGRGGGDGGRV